MATDQKGLFSTYDGDHSDATSVAIVVNSLQRHKELLRTWSNRNWWSSFIFWRCVLLPLIPVLLLIFGLYSAVVTDWKLWMTDWKPWLFLYVLGVLTFEAIVFVVGRWRSYCTARKMVEVISDRLIKLIDFAISYSEHQTSDRAAAMWLQIEALDAETLIKNQPQSARAKLPKIHQS